MARLLTDAGLLLGEAAAGEWPAAAGRSVVRPLGRVGGSAAGGGLWQLPGCDGAGGRGVVLVLAGAELLGGGAGWQLAGGGGVSATPVTAVTTATTTVHPSSCRGQRGGQVGRRQALGE